MRIRCLLLALVLACCGISGSSMAQQGRYYHPPAIGPRYYPAGFTFAESTDGAFWAPGTCTKSAARTEEGEEPCGPRGSYCAVT